MWPSDVGFPLLVTSVGYWSTYSWCKRAVRILLESLLVGEYFLTQNSDFQEKIKYKQLKDELDKLQDKGDLQSGRVSDLKQELHTTKEQLSHYQEETRRLDKEVSQLQSKLSEEQVIHKRLSMYFKRLSSCRVTTALGIWMLIFSNIIYISKYGNLQRSIKCCHQWKYISETQFVPSILNILQVTSCEALRFNWNMPTDNWK